MMIRNAAALTLLLAAWVVLAQPQHKNDDSTRKSKNDSTQKKETGGARELFYLAVAPKDPLPAIRQASQNNAKKSQAATTATSEQTQTGPQTQGQAQTSAQGQGQGQGQAQAQTQAQTQTQTQQQAQTQTQAQNPPDTQTQSQGQAQGQGQTQQQTQAGGTAPVVHLGIRYNVVLVGANNQVQEVDAEHVFHSGDEVALQVEANHSGYLYVLARQSSGKWMALLPSAEMPEEKNVIDPGRRIRVPGQYNFVVSDPPGSEHLVLVFSRDPQDFYDLYQGLTSPPKAAPAQSPAPQPIRAQSSSDTQMADSRVGAAISRMRQQFTRDLVIRRVNQPLSAGEPAGSVYVVNASNKPAASMLTEIEIKHR